MQPLCEALLYCHSCSISLWYPLKAGNDPAHVFDSLLATLVNSFTYLCQQFRYLNMNIDITLDLTSNPAD